ncbi:MAG: ABC transporter permease [bacterium]|nr:ABC transporter permease [bacterium]
MLNFWPVYKREVKTYFQSPSTYVVLALFFLIVSLIYQDLMTVFSSLSASAGQQSMFGQTNQAPNVTDFVIRQTFQILTSLVMFTIPMLSMRLVAEEKNRGTFELLVTCPLGDWAILMGKYLALVTVGLVIVILSGVYPLIAWWMGRANGAAPEWPIVVSCWIALLLIFSAYSAFGVMASSFTENQISAGIVTLIGLILWNVLGVFQMEKYPKVREILTEFSAGEHTENFIRGVLMLKDFAFYILASFLFLFIASKTLDARRWRI